MNLSILAISPRFQLRYVTIYLILQSLQGFHRNNRLIKYKMTNYEPDLIKRAQGGESRAFAQILEQNYSMIFRVAYRFTGSRHDAEDIAQEVCMRLAEKIQNFRNESSFSTWLYRIVVNACHDLHKKQNSYRRTENRYTDFEENNRASDNDSKQKIAWLYRTIYQLDPTLKETAILILTEELSHAEAGKILGCAESTISWRMHEVRKLLKTAMSNNNE